MSDGPLSPEEVAHRGFGTTFRGFDTAEVRTYLQRVANDLRAATARERELHKRLADAEHRAAHPVLEGEVL
ncbi:MAG: DivIVA domain-containing protein, partial [Acidimicrobiales bacterium]